MKRLLGLISMLTFALMSASYAHPHSNCPCHEDHKNHHEIDHHHDRDHHFEAMDPANDPSANGSGW